MHTFECSLGIQLGGLLRILLALFLIVSGLGMGDES